MGLKELNQTKQKVKEHDYKLFLLLLNQNM